MRDQLSASDSTSVSVNRVYYADAIEYDVLQSPCVRRLNLYLVERGQANRGEYTSAILDRDPEPDFPFPHPYLSFW